MKPMVGLPAAPELRGFNEDMAEYYSLPRFGIGGVSGSKDIDQQSALESALTLLTSTLSGAQLIHDVGYLDNGTTGSLEQLIICDETIGWVRQFMKEIVINEETLALDLIDEVVKNNGDFLQTQHTLKYFKEDYYPELIERQNYDTWQKEGSLTLRERARKKIDRILNEHKTVPPPQEVLKKLKEIVERV